jgi:type I restriction enzyme R subunit
VESTLKAAGVAANPLLGSSRREEAQTSNKQISQSLVTSAATNQAGDRRAGVIWHTQGSGKSLSMVFYAGKIVQHPAMENPTIVVLTDRNDLDDQLFDTFSFCKELLRQIPVQAESREHLRKLLDVASGGVVFTTIQKFFPDEKGGKHPLLKRKVN